MTRALAALAALTLAALLTACAPDNTIELHVTNHPTSTVTPHHQ